MLKVLVACEFSGVVRDAFLKRGYDAISCDLEDTERPGPHYQGDIRDILYDKWDLVIAHPPCTHLAVSGARHFAQKRADGRQQQGIDFFMLFTRLTCAWMIENPVGIMSTVFRKPDQIIQPWQFGDTAQKATCLWLNKLPLLQPTHVVDKGDFYVSSSGRRMPAWYGDPVGPDGKKIGYSTEAIKRLRSRTFTGIAEAIADQFGAAVLLSKDLLTCRKSLSTTCGGS